MTVDELRGKLAYAQKCLDAANEAMDVANKRTEAAQEMGGGIPGFGGSGNQLAAKQVRGAMDSAHRQWKEAAERVEKWAHRVRRLEIRNAEIERPRITREEVLGSSFIHDGTMWRRVVKVNAKTVSVYTGYSWVDRVPFEKIREVRKVEA